MSAKHSAAPTRAPDRRRDTGRCGEDYAAGHLSRLGFQLLARNVRTRFGEIDAIAFDGKTIVFVEVKTRRVRSAPGRATGPGSQRPQPLESLRPSQQVRLRRLARAWLSDPSVVRPTAMQIRFDAIGVLVDSRGALISLEHLEAAW
jgi:putative endonuclease